MTHRSRVAEYHTVVLQAPADHAVAEYLQDQKEKPACGKLQHSGTEYREPTITQRRSMASETENRKKPSKNGHHSALMVDGDDMCL